MAYFYQAYANDKQNGTSDAANFHDAVRMHRLLDRINESSADFLTDRPNGAA